MLVIMPTCADNVLLIPKSLYELQTMLLIQEDYANKERYFISESKIKPGNYIIP